MLQSVLSSFGLVALSEMGDKTQLLALLLASRFRKPWAIMAGIFAATILNHSAASFFGAWVSSQVPPVVMTAALGLLFVAFGVWTLKPDTYEEEKSVQGYGAFLTTTVLFFLAEMGDKTQLATIALAARFQDPWTVTFGTTMGMLLTDGLAVFLGDQLAKRVSMKAIRIVAAGAFFLFGALTLDLAIRIYDRKIPDRGSFFVPEPGDGKGDDGQWPKISPRNL